MEFLSGEQMIHPPKLLWLCSGLSMHFSFNSYTAGCRQCQNASEVKIWPDAMEKSSETQ